MPAEFSLTKAYYSLLDLDKSAQQAFMQKLALSHPALHQQLIPMLAEHTHSLTQIIASSASQAAQKALDVSGKKISKYIIGKELGRGGMGVVYSAKRADNTYEQELAIKFIAPDLSHILGEQFLYQEAQLMADLNHPYIAKVMDAGTYDNCAYIVMEKVSGNTLDSFLRHNQLSATKKLKIFHKICKALEHAHQHQILHADLKPENIIIDAEHNPKLLDFNLTQNRNQPVEKAPLLVAAYSENYASPEQRQGNKLTAQSDIYSLGKILSLLFPLRPSAQAGATRHKMSKKHDIHCVTTQAQQAESQQRYANVTALRLDIENILAKRPIVTKQHLRSYVFFRVCQRKPWQILVGLLLILSFSISSFLLFKKEHQLQRERRAIEKVIAEITTITFSKQGHETAFSAASLSQTARRHIIQNPDIAKKIKDKIRFTFTQSDLKSAHVIQSHDEQEVRNEQH